MTRIVSGTAGGRRIRVPPGRATRPTTDRVREALFSAVESALGTLSGVGFLDLYAGSGAVGLEAASRGASPVVLVEQSRRAAAVARTNAAALGLPARVVAAKVEQLTTSPPPEGGFDVVFLDPPYAIPTGRLVGVLENLRDNGWLGAEALVVLERPTREGPVDWPEGIEPGRVREYGETTLWYGHASGHAGPAGPTDHRCADHGSATRSRHDPAEPA